MNKFPSFEIRFDSLDFFGSFLYQDKNEQLEIWITISVGDFVSIVAEKRATISPKSRCAYGFDQGLTALATKMPPLWGFGICKLSVFGLKFLYG